MDEISPEVEEILERSITFAEEGNLNEALIDCEKAKELAPKLDFVYFLMGMIQEKMGLIDNAIISYKKAISISPRYFEAYDRLSVMRREKERLAYKTIQNGDFQANIGVFEEEPKNDGEEIPGYYYLSYQSYIYQGFPGHRLLPGKSGLDPMDTYLEQAYIEGVLVRQLFTLKLTTSNPFYILMGTAIGTMLSMPILLSIFLFNQVETRRIIILLIATIPYWIVGLVLLWNMGKSIFHNNKTKTYE